VTGISNAAGGDDIISNAKPLIDSDDVDEDEDESVANPKAVLQVASVSTQDMPNQDDDSQGFFRSHDTNSRHADCHFGFGVSRQGQMTRSH
jgi:hypothetical protein